MVEKIPSHSREVSERNLDDMSEMSEKVSLGPRKNHWKHLDDVKVEAGKTEKQEFI